MVFVHKDTSKTFFVNIMVSMVSMNIMDKLLH